jgi:hypothetical protein
MIPRLIARLGVLLALLAALLAVPVAAQTPVATPVVTPPEGTSDLDVTDARVRHIADLGLLVFEIDVAGQAGATVPEARGQMDGAPVLAYVFPTSLTPDAVGFAATDGVLALVVTVHPDFDDTPLWDENRDGAYDNDGVVYHTHWVVLVPDDRVPGGLAVKEIVDADPVAVLPPTGPGMPLYLDSPGFDVRLDQQTLRVLVPAARINADPDFTYDAATAYLEVNMSDPSRPTLGVYQVYSLLSGDLSLPYEIIEE